MLEEMMAHMYKQWKIVIRRPGEVANLLIYPFISLLTMGIYAWFLISMGAPMESMLFAFVGVNVWNFYELSQRGITYGVLLEVWSDSMKHFITGRFRLRDFVGGNSLFGLITAILSLVVISAIGMVFFGFNIFQAGAFLWLDLFFIFLFAIAFGLFINSFMVAKGEKYMSLVWVNTGVVMIFSGVYYPVSVLPSFLQPIAYALPPTYLIDSIRLAIGGDAAGAMGGMLIGGLLAFAYMAAGILVFGRALRKGRELGTLVKY